MLRCIGGKVDALTLHMKNMCAILSNIKTVQNALKPHFKQKSCAKAAKFRQKSKGTTEKMARKSRTEYFFDEQLKFVPMS